MTFPAKMHAAPRGLFCQLPLPISVVSASFRVIRGCLARGCTAAAATSINKPLITLIYADRDDRIPNFLKKNNYTMTFPDQNGCGVRVLVCQLPNPFSAVSAFIRVIRGSRHWVLAARAGPRRVCRAAAPTDAPPPAINA